MKQQNNSLQEFMYGYIETFWELVISEAKAKQRSCDEMGGLHYERGRYFITKMEHSLRKIEVEPLPHLQDCQQMKLISIPVVQTMEDDPPTIQFNQVCHAISQKQIQQQSSMLVKNHVSQTDYKISQESIQQAIELFEKQLMKNQPFASKTAIQQKLSMAKGKRAIIYMIGSQYEKAANQFRSIISQLESKQRQQHITLIAEYTFLLGNCHLLLDQSNCEIQAQSLFMKSLSMYLIHLNSLGYQTKDFTLPIDGKQVDRFPYLNKSNDPPSVKIIKEVMSIILDKIEDIHQLIHIRHAISQQQKTIMKKYENRKVQSLKAKQIEAVPLKIYKRKPQRLEQSRQLPTSFEQCKQDDKSSKCVIE